MYPISIAAEQSGVKIETIRYYEREGIVAKPSRSAAGRRTYTIDEISRLRFVKRCRDLGFPIPEAKSLLGLTDGSQESCSSALSIAEEHLHLVRDKINNLMKMQTALEELIDLCSDNDGACPIVGELLSR